ncbi:MAG: hypothetical protein RUMPE_00925 [Eubacteriales bacterium SKADARSKE-1]|nr:hypothetical protein [Eubacteriales bacterium SKADARSKE-1]
MYKIISTLLIFCFCISSIKINLVKADEWKINPSTGTPIVASKEEGYCKAVPPMSWPNFLNGSYLFLGGACALGGLVSFLTTAGSLSWGLSQIYSLKYCYEDVKELGFNVKTRIKNKLTSSHKDPDKTIAALKNSFKEIKGQETPKSTIERFLYMIIHDKNLAHMNEYEYSHADVMLFIGASGVGKTLAALKVAGAQGEEPLVLSAADVDRRSNETLIDQLFGLDVDRYGNNSSLKRSKNLAKYLKAHPKRGVIIINESDKLNPNGELDEILRGAMDSGTVNIKGQVFDFSGALIILTSNESSSCVNKGNFAALNPEEEEDGTGSRTIAMHDKSFLNRVKIVEFDNLTRKEYFKIAQKEFSEKVVDYWKKYADTQLVIPDETFEKIATKTEKENKGARYLDRIRANLVKEVIEKVKNGKTNVAAKRSKLFVYYDELLDRFELSKQQISDYYDHDLAETAAVDASQISEKAKPDLQLVENHEVLKTPECAVTTEDKASADCKDKFFDSTTDCSNDERADSHLAENIKTALVAA